jgi:hypothetical protein
MQNTEAFLSSLLLTTAAVLIVFNFQHADANYASKPGIPLGIIYDLTTSNDTINLVNQALQSMNSKLKYGRTKWSIEASQINTDDTPLLIQTSNPVKPINKSDCHSNLQTKYLFTLFKFAVTCPVEFWPYSAQQT